jgi:DeoR family transcriptional regulator, ulaG and ulaABCDEF operon transcriptional repressor
MQTDVILLQAERRLMARASTVILLVDSSKFRSTGGARGGRSAIDWNHHH